MHTVNYGIELFVPLKCIKNNTLNSKRFYHDNIRHLQAEKRRLWKIKYANNSMAAYKQISAICKQAFKNFHVDQESKLLNINCKKFILI